MAAEKKFRSPRMQHEGPPGQPVPGVDGLKILAWFNPGWNKKDDFYGADRVSLEDGSDGLSHQYLIMPCHQIIFQLADLLIPQFNIELLCISIKGRNT